MLILKKRKFLKKLYIDIKRLLQIIFLSLQDFFYEK